MSRSVQNTHIKKQVRSLHEALMDIISVFNRRQGDEMMIREAGISLDRALFPLLVGIERRGPIGVVDLADRMGRDYTTVSRQVAKLESLGLVKRHASKADRRVSEATITPDGKAMTDAVDRARERIVAGMFASWDGKDVEDLVRLIRKLADAMTTHIGPA
ncbi:MarR family winged helix-turn-helix transcriptional regulator [Bradyrhizobium sp. BR 10289]|uniref:MarR family winged helix-turn-helix transcriptional regulator n=1 Tax=Bradyrhizobium sp. BR 10289 TaxID=2749993 RepID=UPI001C653514|nr:MarR family winged helix-turn-helix transcriptional regulator [Bradyrhizobium sp. BR 10289]MBW7970673.1 winged helix-turn-helix transcriptional regulator [Bradyrhizobium sp. BR 10289]